MSRAALIRAKFAAGPISVMCGLALFFIASAAVQAQIIERQVAGVWIDADGILRNVERDELNKLRQVMQASLTRIPGELSEMAELRKVSLRRLAAAIAESNLKGSELPDDIKYLAGLQRIRYVFVYPEEQDIVLAGPGEGWTINEQGEVVGITTGKPVLLLDDLLVALRSAEPARQVGISCSIDPTSEGLQRVKKLISGLKTIGNPSETLASIEQTLGQQMITVTGVPADSHFARVIVAADYKMKRLAMNFDKAPVKGMPSYLELVKGTSRGMQNMLPRWWLAPSYGALLADPDAMAWELRDAAVKVVAEEDFLTESGSRERSGKASAMVRKWADNMTAHYSELSQKDVVFAQLRNCIDLAVVAALITKENLIQKAGHSMPVLMDSSRLTTVSFHAPRQVPSQASVFRRGRNWIISASGGVQIESWAVAEKQESGQLAPTRTAALTGKPAASSANTAKSTRWWWN